ncbi:MAG: hypothetical protein WKF34_11715 [Pyrinomonadaceae bacterium]
MKSRIFAVSAFAVLMFSVVGFALFQSPSVSGAGKASRLVSLLPASDGVVVFDPKRFLNDALPKVLSANQPMLGEVTSKIDEMAAKTGIDLRKFDQVAVGISMKQVGSRGLEAEPVAIASGDINAGALIAVGKLAANGSYREEKIGGKTAYVFTAKDVLKNAPVKPTNTKLGHMIEQAVNSLTKEVAVSAIDANTLVLGSLPRVRETLEGKTRVSADITGLLTNKPSAVVAFAVKPVGGLSQFLPMDNDELGKNVDAIQYLSGSLDVTASGASLNAMARTKQADQAVGLKDTLEGLQALGNMYFGSSKRPDQQVYGRMIKAAKFGVTGSDVTLDLLVQQSDIDFLIGKIK